MALDQTARRSVTQAKTRDAALLRARVMTVTPSQVARIAVTMCAPSSSWSAKCAASLRCHHPNQERR
jgi:hypothetical protein